MKHSYTLETKLQYLFGDKKTTTTIPRSTKQYWKNSKVVTDFCYNNLWQKLDDVEPAKLFFENKNLHEQCNLLAIASAGLCKIIVNKNFTSSQKDEVVATIDKLLGLCSLAKACSYFNISTQQYYAWKNNNGCHQSVIKLCRKKFPNQLTSAEVGLIKKYMEDGRYLQWSRVSVYWQLCKTEGNIFAKSTFYKYCNALGFAKRKGIKKCKKSSVGIKATAVGAYIHIDVTEVYAKNYEKAAILFVQDNFSRKIIGYHVAKENSSLLNAATVYSSLQNINAKAVVADGGSENKGALDDMLKQHFPLVQKIIAKVDVPFANNMVEALHHKIKHQIFPKDGFDNFDAVAFKLPDLVELYNSMPHDSLNGGTPNEIFEGIFPDLVYRVEQLKNAGVVRLKLNKGFWCCEDV